MAGIMKYKVEIVLRSRATGERFFYEAVLDLLNETSDERDQHAYMGKAMLSVMQATITHPRINLPMIPLTHLEECTVIEVRIREVIL